MVFSSFTFLFGFLPCLLLLYYLVPRRFRQGRNLVLLVFSLVFYAVGGVNYLGLMVASILVNYLGGRLVARGPSRRWALVGTVVVNLGLLGWFKYAGFVAGNLNALGLSIPVPAVTLPIGISFFTFQGMSYVIDVYRKKVPCQKNPLKVALYIALFPQLVAGPIVRYGDIVQELDRDRESLSDFSQGLVRFCLGLGKKLLLANTMGLVVDDIFSMDLAGLSCGAAWVGVLGYTLQVYFDFSGYSDMAIGLGRMLGFHFPENFNYPYISCSVSELWRRWHITLTTWFRDYVYFPLGGNRTSRWKYIRNILLVWTLTGLWHGAAWTYALWGLWNGLWILGEKVLWPKWVDRGPKVLHWLATALVVSVGWTIFRAESLPQAVGMLRIMLGLGGTWTSGQAVYYLLEYWPEWILGILACLPIKPWLEQRLPEEGLIRVWGPKLLALGVFCLCYVRLITSSFNPFLYFQF